MNTGMTMYHNHTSQNKTWG